MRAVIDTNVIVSGLLWRGAPHDLMEKVRGGALGMISSPALFAELTSVISRTKFDAILTCSGTSCEMLLSQVHQLAEIVEAPPLAVPVCRDPDDDAVLALGIAAQVDLIISGDNDLLSLLAYQGIPIVTAEVAIGKIKAAV